MARPREQLAARLARIQAVAVDGVVKSARISRADREALLRRGWLSRVCRGWYLLHAPGAREGGAVAWYGSIDVFLRLYLSDRFGEGWCLSAEASLAVHAGSTRVPSQVVVITARGGAMTLPLPHGTSLFMYPDPGHLPKSVLVLDGLRVMELPEALLRCSVALFRTREVDVAIALRAVRSPLALARTALEAGPIDGVGRLVGALRALGDGAAADALGTAIEASGHSIVETNPFVRPPPRLGRRPASPYARRLAELWARMRGAVATTWPAPPPGLDADQYLDDLDDRAARDAWHSLSIEGYQVTPELIEAVRAGTGAWDDVAQRDALAASGYLRAQRAVRHSVSEVLGGRDAADIARRDLDLWHQAMFLPQVEAGLIDGPRLLGYRRQPVYIRGSRHVPPPSAAVPDAMEELFEQLRAEPIASVRAVLGHFLFTWIHPFLDGNGRLGRFLMNLQLASGGYAWTVVRVEDRRQYMAALEAASVDGTIQPFSDLLLRELTGV